MEVLKKIARKLRSKVLDQSRNPALNINCTEFEVDNWLISEFIINKLVSTSGVHPYPITELNLMAAAVCRFKPQQIFEWGTNIGKSARIFYETGRYFNIPIQIYSIDLPDDVEHGEHPRANRGYLVKGKAGVALHQGDGLKTAVDLYSKNPTQSTLVFIDGDHSYESVFRELNGIIDAMPNAAILLHDTFYQSDAARYNIGPYQAILDTLKARPDQYRQISTTTGLPGMTLLYKS